MTQNLFQKLLAITEDIGKIEKTGKNAMQGYAFTEHAQVVAEVRVRLKEHGVMIIPETVSRTVEHFTSAKGTVTFHANVVSRYTLVNVDDPSDRMVCEWDAGEALDTSDKATPKATTSSQKYFLMKLFNISDKDDPDFDSNDVTSRMQTAPQAIKEIGVLLDAKGITDHDTKQRIVRKLSDGEPLNTSGIARIKKEIIKALPDTLEALGEQE